MDEQLINKLHWILQIVQIWLHHEIFVDTEKKILKLYAYRASKLSKLIQILGEEN